MSFCLKFHNLFTINMLTLISYNFVNVIFHCTRNTLRSFLRPPSLYLLCSWIQDRDINPSIHEASLYDGDPLQFRIRYYMFALVFVVFDVETVFLYPWAMSFDVLGVSVFIEAFISSDQSARTPDRLCPPILSRPKWNGSLSYAVPRPESPRPLLSARSPANTTLGPSPP
jgi:hypothetical protein